MSWKAKLVAGYLSFTLTLSVGNSCIPRDPHPERTPSPEPVITYVFPLQSGRQK